MDTHFGGETFHYEDPIGTEKTVKINDRDLYKGLRQLQTFENYDTGNRVDPVAVVFSRREWLDTLNKLRCEPDFFINSNKFRSEELYSEILQSDYDGVIPLLNGSKSERKKNERIEAACLHSSTAYLGEAREQLIENNQEHGMDGIINWLNGLEKDF